MGIATHYMTITFGISQSREFPIRENAPFLPLRRDRESFRGKPFMQCDQTRSVVGRMKLTRKHVLVEGKVQGVGFRWSVWRRANELGLTG